MSKLYIIPTPIGNLEDITLRALNVLKTLDILLAEDTRKTGILLSRYNISVKMSSYHMHNEHKTVKSVIDKIQSGFTIGLVSDAGTPGISDPGFLLVREAINAGIDVECLPGAVAFAPALVCSGIPCDKFCFEGFLPVKKGRQTKLASLTEEQRTMVFYESPHRLVKTLKEMAAVLGEDRKASVSREISKIHEENARGSLAELIKHFENATVKGEITMVIAGAN